MPNYCDVTMRIKGKRWNVMKMLQWLEADYSYYDKKGKCVLKKDGKTRNCSHHFYRVFETYYDPREFAGTKRNRIITQEVSLVCAWSFYCCFRKGWSTYYSEMREQRLKKGIIDYGICIEKACRMLKVSVEIFSTECGMQFSEHVFINEKGKVLIDDEGYYYEMSKENFADYADYVAQMKERGFSPNTGKEEFERLYPDDWLIECENQNPDGTFKWQQLLI